MYTAVIDLDRELRDPERIEPFLYPLQAEDELRFFLAGGDAAGLDRLDRAKDELSLFLGRRFVKSWQAVVLIGMPPPAGGPKAAPEPISAGCLAQRIHQMHTRIFSPLRQAGFCPEHVFVVVLDRVARDPATSVPRVPEDRLRWQIDLQGFVSSGISVPSYLFDEAAVENLDAQCGKIDLGKESPDKTADQLSPSKREKIAEYCSKTTSVLDALMAEKRKTLEEWAGTAGGLFHGAALDRIREEFHRRLLLCSKDKVATLEGISPGRLLKDLLGECFSAGGISAGEYQVLTISQGPNDFRNLVELAYVLVLLANHPEALAHGVGSESFWRIEGIELDLAQLETLLPKYQALLAASRSDLLEKLHHPMPSSLELFDDGCCNGGSTFEPGRIPHPGVKPNRDSWKRWSTELQNALDGYLKQAEKALHDCRDRLANAAMLKKREVVADIQSELRELERIQQEQKAALATGEAFAVLQHSWPGQVKKEMSQIPDLLAALPSRRPFAATIAASMIMFAIPYVLTCKVGGISGDYLDPSFLVPLVVMLAGPILVALVVQIYTRFRFRSLTEKVYDEAERIRHHLRTLFEQNQKRLLSLCRLRIAAQNVIQARSALAAAEKRKVQRNHHLEVIRKRLQWSEQFMKQVGIKLPSDAPGVRGMTPEPGAPKTLIDCDKPSFQNPGYSLANGVDAGAPTCHVSIQGAVHELEAISFPGLKAISIVGDPAFWRK